MRPHPAGPHPESEVTPTDGDRAPAFHGVHVNALAARIGTICVGLVVAGGAIMLLAAILGLAFGDWAVSGSHNPFGTVLYYVAIGSMLGLIAGPVLFLWFVGVGGGAIVGGQTISRLGYVVTVPWSLWVVVGLFFGPLAGATTELLDMLGLDWHILRVVSPVWWLVGAGALTAAMFLLPALAAIAPPVSRSRSDQADRELRAPGGRAAAAAPVVGVGLIAITVALFALGLLRGSQDDLLRAAIHADIYYDQVYRPLIVLGALSLVPGLGLIGLGLTGGIAARGAAADEARQALRLAAQADLASGVALTVLTALGVLYDYRWTATFVDYVFEDPLRGLSVAAMALACVVTLAGVALQVVAIRRTTGVWNSLDAWLVASVIVVVLIYAHRAFDIFFLSALFLNSDYGWEGALARWHTVIVVGWVLVVILVLLRGLFWATQAKRLVVPDRSATTMTDSPRASLAAAVDAVGWPVSPTDIGDIPTRIADPARTLEGESPTAPVGGSS